MHRIRADCRVLPVGSAGPSGAGPGLGDRRRSRPSRGGRGAGRTVRRPARPGRAGCEPAFEEWRRDSRLPWKPQRHGSTHLRLDSGDHTTFRVPGQHPVQMICERLPVAPAQGGGSAGVYPAGPQRIHEVAHVEPLTDGVRGMELAARAERMDAVLHHLGRQWYVGGDDEVAGPVGAHPKMSYSTSPHTTAQPTRLTNTAALPMSLACFARA